MALKADLAQQFLDLAKNNITGGVNDASNFVNEAKKISSDMKKDIKGVLDQASNINIRQIGGTIDLGQGFSIERLGNLQKGNKGFAQYSLTSPDGGEKAVVHTSGSLRSLIQPEIERLAGIPDIFSGKQSARSSVEKAGILLGEIGSATDISADEINSLSDQFKESKISPTTDRSKDQGFGVFINNAGQPVAAKNPEQRDSFEKFGFREASEQEASKILEGGTVQAAMTNETKTSNLLLPDDANKKANDNVVNHLYNYYFDRNAYIEELDNWGKNGGDDTTVEALEIFLQREQKLNNYVSEAQRQSGVTEPGTVKSTGEGTTGATGTDADTGLPTSVTDSSEYQGLNQDMKDMIELMFTSMNAKDEQTAQLAEDALREATKIVDPFTKVMAAFALDQIPDQFKTTKMSLENQLTSNQETLQEIENLKQDATLEEQQTLNSLSRNFEQNVVNVQDQMADAGLTFSSKRTDLERFVGQQNADIVQSTKRGFQQKSRNLARSQQQTERQEKLIRQAGEAQLKSLARGAEETLGTDRAGGLGLKGLSGQDIGTVGGTGDTPKFAGNIEQQRQQQILNLAQQVKQFESPQQLDTLFNS